MPPEAAPVPPVPSDLGVRFGRPLSEEEFRAHRAAQGARGVRVMKAPGGAGAGTK